MATNHMNHGTTNKFIVQQRQSNHCTGLLQAQREPGHPDFKTVSTWRQ